MLLALNKSIAPINRLLFTLDTIQLQCSRIMWLIDLSRSVHPMRIADFPRENPQSALAALLLDNAFDLVIDLCYVTLSE